MIQRGSEKNRQALSFARKIALPGFRGIGLKAWVTFWNFVSSPLGQNPPPPLPPAPNCCIADLKLQTFFPTKVEHQHCIACEETSCSKCNEVSNLVWLKELLLQELEVRKISLSNCRAAKTLGPPTSSNGGFYSSS